MKKIYFLILLVASVISEVLICVFILSNNGSFENHTVNINELKNEVIANFNSEDFL